MEYLKIYAKLQAIWQDYHRTVSKKRRGDFVDNLKMFQVKMIEYYLIYIFRLASALCPRKGKKITKYDMRESYKHRDRNNIYWCLEDK